MNFFLQARFCVTMGRAFSGQVQFFHIACYELDLKQHSLTKKPN